MTLDRNIAGGIIGVTIRDDGLSMSPERVEEDFKLVGNSWKLGCCGRVQEDSRVFDC